MGGGGPRSPRRGCRRATALSVGRRVRSELRALLHGYSARWGVCGRPGRRSVGHEWQCLGVVLGRLGRPRPTRAASQRRRLVPRPVEWMRVGWAIRMWSRVVRGGSFVRLPVQAARVVPRLELGVEARRPPWAFVSWRRRSRGPLAFDPWRSPPPQAVAIASILSIGNGGRCIGKPAVRRPPPLRALRVSPEPPQSTSDLAQAAHAPASGSMSASPTPPRARVRAFARMRRSVSPEGRRRTRSTVQPKYVKLLRLA